MKPRTAFNLSVVVIAATVVALLFSLPSKGQDREEQKATARMQLSEFCAHVKKPPQAIADALNNAMAQDAKTWLPAVLWWNRIVDRYKELGCGDS